MLEGGTVFFCISCGKRLAYKCERCAEEFIVGYADKVLFCPSCGVKFPNPDRVRNDDLVNVPA